MYRGYAISASGNTSIPWVWSDGDGQQAIGTVSSGGPAAINNDGHVVGTRTCCGADSAWLWTPQSGMTMLHEYFNFPAAGLSAPSARDINDNGQILIGTYDNSDGASCALVTCTPGVANDDCADAAPIAAGDTLFTTLGATTDGPTDGDACGGAFSFGQDIWYLYEPEGPGTLTVSTVEVNDLIMVITAWDTEDPAADVNDDGIVNVDDLVQVVANWGPCP